MKYILLFILCPLVMFSQVQVGSDIDAKTEGDLFGEDTALSDDGSILAVASPNNDDNGLGTGLVQVFEYNNGGWTQIGQDLYGQAEGSAQPNGISVDLSSNGNILAFGAAFNAVENLSDAGEVKIYENINGTWSQIGQTIQGEFPLNLFGFDVTLSSEGDTIAISGVGQDGTSSFNGLVKVFENVNGAWTQVGQTLSGSQDNEFFGDSISISSNGNIIIVGAPGFNNFDGRVKVYENINGLWTQIGQDILALPQATNQEFGSSVSISSNGNTIAASTRSISSGYVRVFENINNEWTEVGGLVQGETPSDYFGYSIDLSNDANVLAVGAVANDGNGINAGHTRIYKNIGGFWTQVGIDIEGEDADDSSGSGISLSSNGNMVAIGAPTNDGIGFNAGHVRVYNLSGLLSTDEQSLSSFNIYPNPAKNQFTIQLENPVDLLRISIYNNLGQLILISKKNIINTSKLADGLYVVKIKTTKGIGSQKLIIE